MASVTERISPATGGSVWRVQFRLGTKNVQRSFLHPEGAYEFKDLVEQIGGAAALRVLERRAAASAAVPTLAEFTMTYLDAESGLLTGVEEGTRAGYRRMAELSFLRILGPLPIDVIERDDIGRWIAWQEKQPSTRRKDQLVSAKTVRNYHGLLSSVLKAAVAKKLRDDNPAFKMRLSQGLKRENVFLSPDEFRTLLHFVPAYYKPLVLFLAGTGLRWGEATALRWEHVNLWADTPTIRVVEAWKKSGGGGPILKHPKSSKARRTVSMHAGLVAALGKPGAGDELVFPGMNSGKHLWYGRFRASAWNPAVEKAMDKELCLSLGLTPLSRQPTPHDLRHTHASWMIAAGIPLPYIQARLGHEKITTTVDVYGHLVPEAHELMASAINRTLDESEDDAIAELEAAEDWDDDVVDAEVVDSLPALEAVVERVQPKPKPDQPEPSERDRQIRALTGEGLSQRQIAARLGVAKTTVVRVQGRPAPAA